jgi:hypothetical protein
MDHMKRQVFSLQDCRSIKKHVMLKQVQHDDALASRLRDARRADHGRTGLTAPWSR